MKIREQLQAMGHARVMVVLKPRVTHRVQGSVEFAAAETQELQSKSARKLMKYFKTFEDSREVLLSQALSGTSMATRSAVALATADGEEGNGAALGGGTTNVVTRTNASSVRYFPRLGVLLGSVDEAGLKRLSNATDDVASLSSPPEFSLIQPIVSGSAALAGPPGGNSWCLTRLRIPELWAAGLTGAGVLVGHLDTGVDAAHPALAGAIDVFAEFNELGDLIPSAPRRDSGYHGTHTAGLIAGRAFNGSRFGAAPGAKLACAIVIERGDMPARVLGGLEWCLDQGCRIINLSLGIRGYDPSFANIMNLLRQRGVLPVAAVGNEGPVTSRSPGNYRQVISVGACDEADAVWWSSSSQSLPGKPPRIVPDLVAPGQDVWSCVPGGHLQQLSGTSMAAPHISGLAALLMQSNPAKGIEDIERAILGSCRRPPAASSIRANRGIPDAVAAHAAL